MKTKKLVCYNCGGHGFITATYENGQTSAICPVCGGIGSHEIQMTNADHIRAMSDEEMTEWITAGENCIRTLCDIICGGECNAIATFKKSGAEACKEIVMKWLQQPAGEEDKRENLD